MNYQKMLNQAAIFVVALISGLTLIVLPYDLYPKPLQHVIEFVLAPFIFGIAFFTIDKAISMYNGYIEKTDDEKQK